MKQTLIMRWVIGVMILIFCAPVCGQEYFPKADLMPVGAYYYPEHWPREQWSRDMENHPHHADWNTWQHYYTYYEGLKSMGAEVTFIADSDPFDPAVHPFMVVPAYQRINRELVKKWEDYVRAGGNLILTCRTGTKDPNGHMWEAKLQEPIWDLIGAEISYYDHLPGDRPGKIEFDGKSYAWHIWGDVLNPASGTTVLGRHEDQFFANQPAIVTRKMGKGSVTYIGAWSDDRELERNVLRKVFQDCGAEILDLPPYVFVEWRDGFWVAVNYTAEEVEIPVAKGAKILVGSTKLPPAGVLVWK